jgi:DNA repair protein RecO (recombination protein O)
MTKTAIRTPAIILSRTDFGEADRILTLLTPEHGKLRLMAKGVRRVKSKLAGGIELFSISDISYLKGRGEIGTLVSSQLVRHFSIVSDLERVQLGYALIKQLHRATEDDVEPEYYELLSKAFAALDERDVEGLLIQLWFTAQLLRLGGNMPNLLTDANGSKLDAVARYNFDYESVSFAPHERGGHTSSSIKVLRLLFSDNEPKKIQQVGGVHQQLPLLQPIIHTLQADYTNL